MRDKFNLILIFSITLFLFSLSEIYANGQTTLFWLTFVLSFLILMPNLIWIKKTSSSFLLPYILTMLKTKRTIDTIKFLSKYGKKIEKMSEIGLIFGFGLTGIDYLYARKRKGKKRIAILLLGAIFLGIFFMIFLSFLFAVNALASLLLLGLISFILLGFGGLSIAFLVGYGVISLFAFFSQEAICPSVAPVIPGVPIPGLGVVIPLIAWISLGMILIIHEASHGILLAYYKEKIKSVGLLLIGIFPAGAFVEQDDKTFDKLSDKKAIAVLSAGPTSNFVTMLIGLIILLLFFVILIPINPIISQEVNKTVDGVIIGDVQETISYCGQNEVAPAFGKLQKNDKVIMLNGVKINNIETLNRVFYTSDKMDFVIKRDGEEFDVNLIPVYFEGLGLKRVGAAFGYEKTDYALSLPITIFIIFRDGINAILLYFIVLSFAVGMFNFLPSDPLDGGKIGKIILRPYFGFMKMNKKDTEKLIGRLFVWIFLISILLNLLPYFMLF